MARSSSSKPRKLKKHPVDENFTFSALLSIVALWWVIEAIDLFVLGRWLDNWGILPRDLQGLIGIPLSPFLHGGFGHVAANSLSFLVFGFMVLKAEKRKFYLASLVIILIGGLGTWAIGRNSIHIGASGLIYGYFGYIMMRGISERRILWILLAIVLGVLFGSSMIWGVLPSSDVSISWEGHLCGMLAGAWFGHRRAKQNRAARGAAGGRGSRAR